jgi:type II secretory ATPase GspE/PulE/Tfp pilus assembly ATPase PilB-like protein
VEGVLAQRLVRVVCRECGVEEPPAPGVAAEMEQCGCGASRIRRGRGCANCRGTGYRVRTGIYELLRVNDEIRGEVLRSRGATPLRQLAIAGGMRPLRADGWRQVAAGVTTPEEVLRVAR